MRRAHTHARSRAAGGGRDRQHRRDDRRWCHAGRHEHPALPAAHDRRGPVAGGRTARCTGCGPSTASRRASRPNRSRGRPGAKPRVNIIGTIYGTFNMPSDLAEIRRLVEGIGAEVNMVFPLGSHLEDVPRLVDADVNVCMYREFGRMLCEALERAVSAGADRAAQHHEVPAHAGRAARGSIPSRSSRKRSTPRSSRSGICGAASRRTSSARRASRIVANETYARGVRHFLEDEMGLPCTFACSRARRCEARQRGGARSRSGRRRR